MKIQGEGGSAISVELRSLRLVAVEVGYVSINLDEKHAQALVLALQAAIAEIQAREVGR